MTLSTEFPRYVYLEWSDLLTECTNDVNYITLRYITFNFNSGSLAHKAQTIKHTHKALKLQLQLQTS